MCAAAALSTVRELLERGAGRLAATSASARLDAELLLGHVLGASRAGLYARPERHVAIESGERYARLLARRAGGEPVAYLLGRREFWSLDLAVTPDVLVPRPETELLVEAALARLDGAAARLLELGTGSGAIALALARERPAWRILATDVSAAALAVAERNRARLNAHNVELHCADWYGGLSAERYAAILSNPPYVAAGDAHLETLAAEPQLALLGGADGLAALREIVAGAPRRLQAGGWLFVEHGATQASAVRALCDHAGLAEIETLRDDAGHERVTLGRAGGGDD